MIGIRFCGSVARLVNCLPKRYVSNVQLARKREGTIYYGCLVEPKGENARRLFMPQSEAYGIGGIGLPRYVVRIWSPFSQFLTFRIDLRMNRRMFSHVCIS